MSLRDRAIRAACAYHATQKVPTCEVGERTTKAVLVEVQEWLFEQAEEYAATDEVTALAIIGIAKAVQE